MSDDIDSITANKLSKLEKNLLEWRNKMTSWERKFCAEHVCRWRVYGPLTKMSVKQRNTLVQIVNKYDV